MAGAVTWVDGDVATATKLNALPRGVMGYVNGSASDQTGITVSADITSLSVAFTAISTRLYRTTMSVNVQQQTAGPAVAVIFISDGAGTGKSNRSVTLALNDFIEVTCVALETGLSGAITRKGRANTSAGTLAIIGTSIRSASIVVEDMGPA